MTVLDLSADCCRVVNSFSSDRGKSVTKTWVVFGMFLTALLCGFVFVAISAETVVPMAARGTGPGGVQVTAGGWLALISSFLGASGFTVAGIVSAIAARLGYGISTEKVEQLGSEIEELTTSFAALMRDKTNRAAQRRFVFALVDATSLINGIETSHEAGVIVVKYRGYADPVPITPTNSAPAQACS